MFSRRGSAAPIISSTLSTKPKQELDGKILLREAAKKVLFLVAWHRGKGLVNEKKELFKSFIQASLRLKKSSFCN